MDRPHFAASSGEILRLIEEHWDDFWQLGLLAYEVQFRRHVAEPQRAALVARLVEIGVSRGRPDEPTEPGFRFPTTDVVAGRKTMRAALGDVPWREVGLLRLSGYRVGRTSGESEGTRIRLLNFIFLRDDLSDVDDPAYAAEWGSPKTATRLQKLATTLAALVRNAKRSPANMSEAISEWESDLAYLKAHLYDKWNEFPWPDADV